VKSSKEGMVYWALQYGQIVEVTKPKDLREKIRETAEKICEKHT
jgi:predicted DNA-binding transcriptional regulator YafY